ncbi:hypothetical protein CBR_g50808 [Chara braunii]|uniref:Uncharacterized protein n=1 Tax=Chara braunii TaxID=69332 RepID=A0A388M7M9_CHABU|nr:hypothetical protein CBR_g50808 [Chara braunii]|eukprot:GBG90462.1 hypothetical protein CBR_g50808 [Chara braunii]
MVETRSGKDTSPYTKEQQEKTAALVKENRERKEREKQAKLKAIAEEQAAKMKELEEEMEKKKKASEEEAAAEEEKERMRIKNREGSSGTKRDKDAEMEKKISEWVNNLSLGEDEEAESYVTQDKRDALASELATMADPTERREREKEQKLEWKLRMKREKKRRREEVNRLTAEVPKDTLNPHEPMAEVAGPCLASCPETTCASVSLGMSLTGVAEELKERMLAWAKMKKESKGQLILVDVEVFRSRVGALRDSGATRSYISRRALKKLRLELKVQKLADPIVSVLADNRTMRVEGYVEGVHAYFRLEKDGKVEKVIHSLTLLVQDDLPFDVVLGMDWGEAAGATLHLREHECRLPSPSGDVKIARMFHVSGVDNTLAHCCLSAPAFARLVKKEQLEDQVFVVYVRPATEAKEEVSSTDPTTARLLKEFKDLTESPAGVVS